MTRKLTCTIEVDGEIYIFTMQRENAGGWDSGELTITSSPHMPKKIQDIIDDLWDGHLPELL